MNFIKWFTVYASLILLIFFSLLSFGTGTEVSFSIKKKFTLLKTTKIQTRKAFCQRLHQNLSLCLTQNKPKPTVKNLV